MARVLIVLKNVFKTYFQKRKHFVGKSELRVVVYTGVLQIQNDSDLDKLLSFQYPFDQQQFDTVVTDVSSEESTTLEKCKQLFSEPFARAIKMIFY
jgi:hypothetical protein